MDEEDTQKIASLDSELRDRISENRALRREAARALSLIESGDHDSAAALLRYLSAGNATD